MKILIRGGTLYDGTGTAPQKADVLVEKDTISAIGPNIDSADAQVIEAGGRAVTPGFVDIHRHCDVAAVCDAEFGHIELAQGITSAIVGNCGLAPIPVSPQWRDEMYDYIAPVVGQIPPKLQWDTYLPWLKAIEKNGLPLHMGFLVGAGAVKIAVNGFTRSALSAKKLSQATEYVREGMEAGASGLSLGLMYQPECWSGRDEVVALARPAARYGGILCTHIRGEGDSLVESVEEVISIAEAAGMPLNISHFKATGIRNWRDIIFRAIERIEAARARGLAVTADFYPYTGGSTTLQSLLPPSVLEDELSVMLQKMGTPAGKKYLCEELAKQHPGWDNMAESIGWERIIVSAVTLPDHMSYQGKSLAQLAQELNYANPAELVADLLYTENGRVGIIVMSMSQQDVDDIARLPYTALISDALYSESNNPHPRLYGAFPRFLREYAMERKVVSVETAIHKMTQMPSRLMKIAGRGILAPGAKADILVFDLNKFTDKANFIQAKQLAEGMDLIFLEGKQVWKNGEMTGQKSGRLILNKS